MTEMTGFSIMGLAPIVLFGMANGDSPTCGPCQSIDPLRAGLLNILPIAPARASGYLSWTIN
jgi:hypothetical protein